MPTEIEEQDSLFELTGACFLTKYLSCTCMLLRLRLLLLLGVTELN
jgi:hypothetical protein